MPTNLSELQGRWPSLGTLRGNGIKTSWSVVHLEFQNSVSEIYLFIFKKLFDCAKYLLQHAKSLAAAFKIFNRGMWDRVP